MQLIVLAAGFATRLYPLTRDFPKPLLEIGGASILDRLLGQFGGQPEVTGATVVVNRRFLPQFAAWHAARRDGLAVALVDNGVVEEQSARGAVRDLQFALRAAPAAQDGYVVSAGDHVLAFDLRPLVARFLATRRPLLALRDLQPPVPPRRYNEVALDACGRVTALREKPDEPRGGLASICLYFLPAGVPAWVDEYLQAGGNPDAPGHFIAWLVARTHVDGERIAGRWFDIGNHESLAQSRAELG